VVVILGGTLGNVIAKALVGYPVVSFLSRDIHVGIDPPFSIDLSIIAVIFGATIRLNLAMLGGIVLAIWILRLLR